MDAALSCLLVPARHIRHDEVDTGKGVTTGARFGAVHFLRRRR
jgi:hypothetical protein